MIFTVVATAQKLAFKLSVCGALSLVPFLGEFSANTAQAADFSLPAEQFGVLPKRLPQSLGSIVTEALHSGRDARFEPLLGYAAESRLSQLGSPTGILDILYEEGSTTCTASIISSNYLLTNWHCLPGTGQLGRALAATFSPNYLDEANIADVEKFVVNPRPLESGGSEVDYAIVSVDGDPAQRFGTLKMSAVNPNANLPLIMFHHPGGQAKQVTRFGCRTAAPESVRGAALLHLCDTLPGSSGAPILAEGTGEVVAIHHAGAARVNLGILIGEIATVSPIVSSLVGSRPTNPKRQTATASSPPIADLEEGLAALQRGDHEHALSVLRQHAALGNGVAQGRLGYMYYGGVGVGQDLVEAAKWFERAAEQNELTSATNLAVMYENGLGVPADAVRAAQLYLQAAEAGDAVAQYNLARIYADGRGIPQDMGEAARWYRLAANQGDLDAQYNLAILLETGSGVLQDRSAALQMYRSAAAGGHAPARDRLFALGE